MRRHVHLPRYMAREIDQLLDRRGDRSFSDFFRSLYDQAKALKAPIFEGAK